jgi:hypothetical protein
MIENINGMIETKSGTIETIVGLINYPRDYMGIIPYPRDNMGIIAGLIPYPLIGLKTMRNDEITWCKP